MKIFILLALSAFLVLNAVYSRSIQTVMASVDYSNTITTFDKTKVLNVARGGQGINSDLTWMPRFYNKLVEVGIKEFRIDWLLSNRFYNVVTRNSSGVLVYNFTYLDKIIVPLAEKGIKPLMCMTYMAGVLGIDSFSPNNYAEYKATIKAYVQHYKDLGYTGWGWESHNEPEGFTKITPAQVYTMYETFSAAVKEVDNTARVGGYGAVGSDWISFFRSFLDIYKADTSRPVMDFFSFHQYGKESWEDVPVIESAFTVRGLVVPNMYITEWNNHWGSAPGQGNAGVVGGSFDTNLNATYMAKKMYNSYLFNNVKKIFFFNFADNNASKNFSGDMGAFTVNFHRKAAANTFKLFDNLYNSLLPANISGTGTSTKNVFGFFTVDKSTKKLSIIFWNYQNSKVAIKTQLSNLPQLESGWEYKVDKLLIDSTHGNYYNDYKTSVRYPKENVDIVETFYISGNTLSHTDTLSKYSVVQYLIEPQLKNTGLQIIESKRKHLINVQPVLFNNSTTINYTILNQQKISLSLYTLSGSLIKVLEEGNKSVGNYCYILSGDNFAKGMYFLVLKNEKNVLDSIKIIRI